MKKEIINFLKKYSNYIFLAIIVILIIIIGFVYSYKVTDEEVKKEIKEEKIDIEEEKQETYKVDIKGEVKHPGVYELNIEDRVIDVIKKADGLTLDADTSYLNLSKKINDEMVIIIYSKDEVKEYRKKQEEINNSKNESISKTNQVEKYEEVKEEVVCPNVINNACIKEENVVTNSEISTKKSNEQVTEKNQIKNENIETNDNEEVPTTDSSNNEEIENNKININTASKEELLTLKGIGEAKADKIIEYRNNGLFNSIEDIKNIPGIGDSIFEKIKDYITT